MDNRSEYTADIRRGVGEAHEGSCEVRAEIHVVGVVAAVDGDVTGHGDGEDTDGDGLLAVADEAEADQSYRGENLAESVADHARRARRYFVRAYGPVGDYAHREAQYPGAEVRQRGHQAILWKNFNNALVNDVWNFSLIGDLTILKDKLPMVLNMR